MNANGGKPESDLSGGKNNLLESDVHLEDFQKPERNFFASVHFSPDETICSGTFQLETQ